MGSAYAIILDYSDVVVLLYNKAALMAADKMVQHDREMWIGVELCSYYLKLSCSNRLSIRWLEVF